MVAANMDSLDPGGLILPLKKKPPHHDLQVSLSFIKCTKNHPNVANKLVTCLFNARQVLRFKSMNTMRPVTMRAVQRSMWSTEPRSLDKRFWLETHGNVFLVVKTGIKICGNRLAPHLSGMQTVSMATWSYKQNSYKT